MDDKIREQIDAFILKFEGQEAEEDTLDCLVWLFEKESKRIALEARIDTLRLVEENARHFPDHLKAYRKTLKSQLEGLDGK